MPEPVPKFIHFTDFEKMNTKLARHNLPEKQVAWMENLQPIGTNDLVAVPAALAPITNVSGKTVTRMFDANYGGVDYVIFFATDGSATQINAANGAQVSIAGPGTFSSTPDLTVYSSQRILVMDPTSGYFTWDGTLGVKSGGISPNIQVTNGGTYAATPSVTISGGSGSGATAHAVMGGSGASQFVASVVLDNPGTGYKPGDTITVAFSPASTTAATARIWPQTTGTSIDVFAGRVWWINNRLLSFTGTNGYDDTNPANAAGSTTITDRDLSHNLQAVRNLNNYLYIFGDTSIRQIGSISVNASVTLFTTLTLASDIGTTYLMTIKSYNRLVLFANKNGVYGIFGATVQKISDDLDGIFQLTDFALQMSAALHDFHVQVTSGGSIHCYMILLKYMDPVRGSRSILCVFQNNKWFVVSQGDGILAVCSLPFLGTSQFEAFASSGADVTQLLQDTTTAVPILLQTSLTYHGAPITAKRPIRAGVAVLSKTSQSFNMKILTEYGSLTYPLIVANPVIWYNAAGQVVQWQNASLQNVYFIAGGFQFPYTSVEGYGKFIGCDVSGTMVGFAINGVSIEYNDADLWGPPP